MDDRGRGCSGVVVCFGEQALDSAKLDGKDASVQFPQT